MHRFSGIKLPKIVRSMAKFVQRKEKATEPTEPMNTSVELDSALVFRQGTTVIPANPSRLVSPRTAPSSTLANLSDISRDTVAVPTSAISLTPARRVYVHTAVQDTTWQLLHTSALAHLENLGVVPANLYDLAGDVLFNHDNALLITAISRANIFQGINVKTGEIMEWTISVEVIPLYPVAALTLLAETVQIPSYASFYNQIIARIAKTIVMMKTVVTLGAALQALLRAHANGAHSFIAVYYETFSYRRKDVNGAKSSIQTWLDKLFQPWDVLIMKAVASAAMTRATSAAHRAQINSLPVEVNLDTKNGFDAPMDMVEGVAEN